LDGTPPGPTGGQPTRFFELIPVVSDPQVGDVDVDSTPASGPTAGGTVNRQQADEAGGNSVNDQPDN
jgi:hypothetical protein